jgi:hypothetical protein
LHELMDSQLWKQRREEVMCEVELNRRATALRTTHKQGDGRSAALVWEMKKQAEGLLTFLRALRNAG